MFILGCGGSIVIVGANAVANEVGGEKRAAALNFLNVFSGLGGLATPFIAGNLLGADPVKTAVFGTVATLVVLAVAILTPMPTLKHSAEHRAGAATSPFGSLSLYLLSSVTFLYTACEFGIWNWLPKYLIATGMPSARALTILSLGFACGLLTGRLLATPLLWRFSPLAITTSCSAAMMVFTYLILRPMSAWMTATLVFLAGIAMAPVFPTTIAIVGKLFRTQSATAIGFTITCGFSGLMLSSPVIGWISSSGSMGDRRGLLLLPLLSGVILLILISSRKLLHSEQQRASEIVTAPV
jgi:fucose permease